MTKAFNSFKALVTESNPINSKSVRGDEIDNDKHTKKVKDMHGMSDIEDTSQDPENYATHVGGKKAVPPHGRSIKEDDSYVESDAISDQRTQIYNLMQRLDLIADSIIYSDQASKVNIFIAHLSDLVEDFDEEIPEPTYEKAAEPAMYEEFHDKLKKLGLEPKDFKVCKTCDNKREKCTCQ